jgi:acyl-CoA synthetase (AMP-forming)/AMP-acid ligase II
MVKKYGVRWTSVMPSILAILLSMKLECKDSGMVGIICGGQVLNEEVKNQFEATFNVPIFEGYGLTETTSFSCFNVFPKNNKRGSVGRSLPCNDMAIFDEHDKEVRHGESGEICVRGLNVMNEYFGLDEINKKSLRGGWFRTGDFGYIDEEGYIYFGTRKDYLIIKGGENIYPSEVENILFAHSAVDECAVIGIPDALMGQEIVAFVKLNEPSTEADLKKFFIKRLASHKHPKRIFILNEFDDLHDIPKGPTKKVLYKVLMAYHDKHLKHD